MRPILLTAFLLSLNLSLAALDAEHRHVHLLRRSDICTENGKVACDSLCMPLGSVCCDDGSGSYCQTDNICIPNGCCPEGETCIGGGGTMTLLDIMTGTGSLPTDPPKTTAPGGEHSVPTLAAIPSLTFVSNPAGPKATGAAPAGSSRRSKSCGTDILDWVALVITIVSVHIIW